MSVQVAAGEGEDSPSPTRMFGAGKEFLGMSRTRCDISLADVQGDAARQIDFPRGEDSDHSIVETYPMMIGDHIDPLELDQGIPMQPPHQFGGSLGIGG